MQERVTSTVLVVNSELYKLYVRGMGGISIAACLLFSLIEVNYGKNRERTVWREATRRLTEHKMSNVAPIL